jgi:hypothetical protein
VPVSHAWMVERVQILEHHSLAYVWMDIPVTAAKLMVNMIFKNVVDLFFLFLIFILHLKSGLRTKEKI